MTSMSSLSGSTPLKFVSEAEIEEKRKKRQEEWEKVRQPHQPIEAPEEVVDTRSLYDQLQAQKDAKQLEYEEQHRLKNQVHGLDKEEAEFLDFVHDRQQEIEKERQVEEMSALEELHNSVAAGTSQAADVSKLPSEKTATSKALATKSRTSQAELLAGAIKRKRSYAESSCDQSAESLESQSSDTATPTVTPSVSNTSSSSAPSTSTIITKAVADAVVTNITASHVIDVARPVAVLPGMGQYTDSTRTRPVQTPTLTRTCLDVMHSQNLVRTRVQSQLLQNTAIIEWSIATVN